VEQDLNMKKYHFVVNIFWVGLSIFIITLSYKLGLGRLRSPGPGFMPFLIGLCLLPASLYSFINLLVQRQRAARPKLEDENKSDLTKVFAVTLSLLVYTFVLEELGYLVATISLLAILFGCGGGKKRWKSVVVASVLTGFITYFGFTYLGVQFPVGIFGF
jgi:cell division protein FtsW (lipid II flippase)